MDLYIHSAGLITLVNYSLNLNYSYPAHPSSITHVKIMKYKNILVSVGVCFFFLFKLYLYMELKCRNFSNLFSLFNIQF